MQAIETTQKTISVKVLVNFSQKKDEANLETQFLLKSLAQGNNTAFWQLWRQYDDYLYNRCRIWMGNNLADTDEALSRAMLKAWQKLPVYAEKMTNPKAWLTRMTHNLCIDIYRERKRNTTVTEQVKAIATIEDEAVLSSPEAIILRQELRGYIDDAIDNLPPTLRQPFIWRFNDEMSYSDIAQKLNLSQTNVRKRIQQARVILQKQLKRYL